MVQFFAHPVVGGYAALFSGRPVRTRRLLSRHLKP